MQLRINHTWPQIGIQTTPGRQSIEQPQARLEIGTHPAQGHMEGEPFHIEINQYQCFAEAGLKNAGDLTRDMVQRSRQMVLEGIGRRVEEGNQLAAIEKGGNPIVEQAVNHALPPPASFNIKFIPQSRPEIRFIGGKKLRIEPGWVETQITPMKPIVDYIRGKTEVYLKQKPELQISWVGNNVDERL